MQGKKISDLKAKVTFVIAHSEYRYIRSLIEKHAGGRTIDTPLAKQIGLRLQGNVIAEHVGTEPSQWARMQKGSDNVNISLLSFLSTYLDLDHYCEAEIWYEPLDIFKQTLRDRSFGKLKYLNTEASLSELLRSFAEPGSVGLRVVRLPPDERGFGIDPQDEREAMEFTPADRVQIEVDLPAGLQYLVVLSEDPAGDFIALSPHKDQQSSAIAGQKALLPDQSSYYPVGRPFGEHRLYAVMTADPTEIEATLDFSFRFPPLSREAAGTLRRSLAQAPLEKVRIVHLRYEVHPAKAQ